MEMDTSHKPFPINFSEKVFNEKTRSSIELKLTHLHVHTHMHPRAQLSLTQILLITFSNHLSRLSEWINEVNAMKLIIWYVMKRKTKKKTNNNNIQIYVYVIDTHPPPFIWFRCENSHFNRLIVIFIMFCQN